MKKIIPLLFLALLQSCNSIQRLYTVFPSAKERYRAGQGNVVRIYFDRVGYIYPSVTLDQPITDAELRSCDSRLGQYYMTFPDRYKQICAFYKVQANPLSDTFNTFELPLQTELVRQYAQEIDRKAMGKCLVFLIHGFNSNPIRPKLGNSFEEFKAAEEAITARFSRQFLFVEIYWDGLDDTNGWQNTVSLHLNDLKIWPHAQASATYVGLELRRILAALHVQHINVLTHSHGAGVITTALFNTHKFDKTQNPYQSLYDDRNSWLADIKQEYNHPQYNCPKQDFTIGMLAPALPGVAVFRDYGHRTIAGEDTPSPLRNYHFVIGFNENDEVTSKFHVIPAHYGSTTLACIPKELAATEKILGNDPQVMTAVDFSTYECAAKPYKQKDHSWLTYMTHQPQFNKFLDETIK